MRIDEKWIRAHLPVDCADEPCCAQQGLFFIQSNFHNASSSKPITLCRRFCFVIFFMTLFKIVNFVNFVNISGLKSAYSGIII